MDPASLGLGAASLAIQVFDGAMKGFEIFEAAANAHKECQGYKIRLRIEYDRLDRWGTITGLNDEKPSDHYNIQLKHNGPLIVATLVQLGTVLKDLRATELQHDLLKDPKAETANDSSKGAQASTTKATDISEQTAQVTISAALASAAIVQVAVPQERSNIVYRARAALKRVAKEPKRFKWVLHDSAKFDKGLIHIAKLVGYLEEMLSQEQMSLLIKSANDFKLMLLQLTTDVGAMKDLLYAGQVQQMHRTSSSSVSMLDGATLVDTADQTGLNSYDSRTVTVPRPTAFWIAATRFSIAVNEAPSGTLPSTQLARSDIRKFEETLDLGSRTIARMSSNERVWVEWRPFEREPIYTKDGRVQWHVPDETKSRVDYLVALLHIAEKPVEFCVPRCLGYFTDHEAQKFGLVFEPPISNGCWPPRSLLSSFGTKGINLLARIKIAQDLTQWLLYLHAVNWLHKGLRSASVLFFAPVNNKSPGKPYVSGFDYSRVVHSHTTPGPAVDDIQRAMYIHPDYLGQGRRRGFKKTYDMYSIGVILVEIAFWKPIANVLGYASPDLSSKEDKSNAAAGAQSEHTNDDTDATSVTRLPQVPPRVGLGQIMGFRDRLLNDGVLEQIEETMGTSYAAATRVCLEGMTGLELADDKDQSDVSVAALMQQGFIDKVVDVLGRISV